MCNHKLQALVYDILPSTTAVFSYAIESRKLSANEQFFVGVQTVVSMLKTTLIISDVCFISDHFAYASSDKTTVVWIETELFLFLAGVDAPHVYVTKSGRVWRKVPESDARSVWRTMQLSTGCTCNTLHSLRRDEPSLVLQTQPGQKQSGRRLSRQVKQPTSAVYTMSVLLSRLQTLPAITTTPPPVTSRQDDTSNDCRQDNEFSWLFHGFQWLEMNG